MTGRSEIYVIDTSSILQVRRTVPKTHLAEVLERLDALVEVGAVVYPTEVVKELERFSNPDPTTPDRPLEWVQKNEAKATRFGHQFETLKEILKHSQVRRVVDPDKAGVEEADPYVLALAVHLKATYDVTVLNEERKDKPHKISIATACGLLKLLSLPMEPFLADRGIWPL